MISPYQLEILNLVSYDRSSLCYDALLQCNALWKSIIPFDNIWILQRSKSKIAKKQQTNATLCRNPFTSKRLNCSYSHDEKCCVLFARKISSEMPLKTSSLWTHWVWAATRCWWAEQATLPDVFGSTRGLGARLQNFNTFGRQTITPSFRCFQRQCYLNWVTLLWSAVAGELSSRCQTWSTLPQVQQEDLKQIAFDVSILRDTGNPFPISKLICLSLSIWELHTDWQGSSRCCSPSPDTSR